MTATDTTFATVVGETAAALLPADHGWTVREGSVDAAVPEGAVVGVRAVVGEHVISIVVTTDMARRIQVGPPPADGLLDGLEPTVDAIASVLGIGPVEPLTEIDPAVARVDAAGEAAVTALVDGEDHLVTVIVVPPDRSGSDDGPSAASFQPIVGQGTSPVVSSGLEVLHDVEMAVTAELGRTKMPLRDILALAPGAVIELDRAASAPVDVMVNGTLVARGEVVVVDEEFGIRINQIIGHEPPPRSRRPDVEGPR